MPHSLGRLVGIVSSSAVAVEYKQVFGDANDAGVEKPSTAPSKAAKENSVELFILGYYYGISC